MKEGKKLKLAGNDALTKQSHYNLSTNENIASRSLDHTYSSMSPSSSTSLSAPFLQFGIKLCLVTGITILPSLTCALALEQRRSQRPHALQILWTVPAASTNTNTLCSSALVPISTASNCRFACATPLQSTTITPASHCINKRGVVCCHRCVGSPCVLNQAHHGLVEAPCAAGLLLSLFPGSACAADV
jgi:hypothetical protein